MSHLTDPRHVKSYRVRIATGGRIVIPSEVRHGLGIREGDEVLLTRDGNGFRIATLEQTVREVQAFFAPLKRDGESVVDEILADRRRDAAEE